jgi:hypothetical protein
MAKKNEVAVQDEQLGTLSVPSFMQNDAQIGTEVLRQYVIPPRVKVVQPTSKEPFSKLFNVGDVVLVPQMVTVAPVILDDKKRPTDTGTPFHFIPVFFFAEWCIWNPYQLKGSLPPIRERTIDPKSEIAIRARNPETRLAPCPEDQKWNIRYCEHLNYCVVLTGEGMAAGTPVVMSFVRSEHRAGSNFASLIKMRRAPIFGCQFEAVSRYRKNDQGEWYGIDVMNPSVESDMGGWVTDEAVYEMLRVKHLELKQSHDESRIVVDHEDPEEEAATEY